MCTRLMSILAIAAICFGSSFAVADEGGQGDQRTCTFQAHNAVVLSVGDCTGTGSERSIPVITNTRTNVCVTATPFTRVERDCEGGLLETVDSVSTVLNVDFVEAGECQDGSPLETRYEGNDCWCVNSHNGGYRILLQANPSGFDICDDAGCYTATVTVNVSAMPFEECEEICDDDE